METLAESCQRCGWKVHAYVLMDNHYHLLLETPEPNLVAGMKWLQGTYTQRFNNRYGECGHLFQGRYKALLVDGESGDYFSTVATYIHLNPARAGLLNDRQNKLMDYPWSSYGSYCKPDIRPAWLSTSRLLGVLGWGDDELGIKAFRNYMERRLLEVKTVGNAEQMKSICRDWCLGSDEFRGRMEALATERIQQYDRRSYSGREVVRHDEYVAEQILKRGLSVCELSTEELPRLAKGDYRKRVIACVIRQNTCVGNDWIAENLCMGSGSNMSRHVRFVLSAEGDEVARLREMIEYEV